jgi:hypothetical protein
MLNPTGAKRAMVSLISEQAMPNVMAPLLIQPRPSVMACILPEDRDAPGQPDGELWRVYDGIRSAFSLLAQDTDGELDLPVRNRGPVSPYDFEAVRATCCEAREELVSQGYEVVYNVTGGTKLMAQAALADAREAECRAVYVDTEFRKLVQVEPVPEKRDFRERMLRSLDVPHYLTAYGLGHRGSWERRTPPEPFSDAARLLANDPSSSPRVLELILRENPGKPSNPKIPLNTLEPEERRLLERIVERLAEGGARISISDDTLEMTVSCDVPDRLYNFWWGRRWLEWYVFSVIDDLNGNATEELRYNRPWWDVQFVWDVDDEKKSEKMDKLLKLEYEYEYDGRTVRAKLPLNELDVTAMRGGRLLLCECKTGRNALQSAHFYKLHVLGRRLGTFADKVFVTDVNGLDDPACEEATVRRQAVRALTLDVAVVGLGRLRNLRHILAEPDGFLREQKVKFGLR